MFEGLFSRFKRDTIIKESDEDLSLDEKNVINEIKDFMASTKRKNMITGEKYYDGKHDILKRKRTVIGQDGELEEIDNLPNNRIVDNQYQKMVDQKNNYLLGQPFSIQTNNDTYAKLLKNIFNFFYYYICSLSYIFFFYKYYCCTNCFGFVFKRNIS